MSNNKRILVAGLGAMIATAALAAASSASADVACNRYGECWHVSQRYTTYPAELGVTFYDDEWAKHHHAHHHWYKDRDNDRGYWQHGHWVAFPG